MKQLLILLLAISCVFTLTGCAISEVDHTTEVTVAKMKFEANVIEVSDTTLLVEPLEGTAERRSADRISVSTDGIGEEASLNYIAHAKVGDTIVIGYHGGVAESYPAQINNTYEIRFVAGN